VESREERSVESVDVSVPLSASGRCGAVL